MSHQAVTSGNELLSFENDIYRTADRKVSLLPRKFPTWSFYSQFFRNVWSSSVKARRGRYGDLEWARTSIQVLESIESVGVKVEVIGVENIRRLESPCVFVGNHMSMFETMVLPGIIQPVRPVTFVVKQSLLDYPVFRHIVGTRNPIAVSRDNPRDDFKAMMQGGTERLKQGISIVVFPQTTRSLSFKESEFNTIGVKLALRAKVPVIPIALKTDAWGNGKRVKDLGPIDPQKRVHISFGEPITVDGRGSQQHEEIISYIRAKLSHWSVDESL